MSYITVLKRVAKREAKREEILNNLMSSPPRRNSSTSSPKVSPIAGRSNVQQSFGSKFSESQENGRGFNSSFGNQSSILFEQKKTSE